jgi:glycosyltransferase involved in cell wall biosynthesis
MPKSIAIVHEWLNTYGGSERLLAEILPLIPQAQLHALIYKKQTLAGTPLAERNVKTSFMQYIPRVERLYRGLLPIMPFAIESLNLSKFDAIISISHAVAHGAKTNPNQIHISYVCTPMRYAWHLQDDYLNLHRLDKPILGSAARLTLNLLRRWDKESASRATHLLAISNWIAEKINQAWNRESHVIYPPVNVNRFSPSEERGDYYLFVSRLVPYKMPVEIIKAFNELKLPLVIAGDGPGVANLMKLANENITFLFHQTDEDIAALMNHAKGFVHMAVEDFGIAMVEAQAAGCPVIAYGKGGASEIVRDGETGLLFQEQSSRGLSEAVLKSKSMKINSKAARCAENAARFSSERFRDEFLNYINKII